MKELNLESPLKNDMNIVESMFVMNINIFNHPKSQNNRDSYLEAFSPS